MTAVDLLAAPRILIAESDPRLRDLLMELVLSIRSDADLEVCDDGQQAREWLERHRPDLVIASWELPGNDGLNLLREIRQLHARPPLPFILLSERNDSASVRKALPLAPTAYLTKPFSIDSLRQRLRDLLQSDPGVDA